MGVGRDVHVVQLHLAIANQAKPVPEVGLACAHGFHFGAQQLNTRFQGFEDVVLMACKAVVRQDPWLVLGIFSAVAPAARAFCHDAALLPLLGRA